MPDPNARPWFINVAKLFSNTSKDFDLVGHAKRLKISDIKDLVGCLDDTTSSTARQIIKLLYSPQQLLTMSGTQVPTDQRKAIRDMFYLDRQIKKECFLLNRLFRSSGSSQRTLNYQPIISARIFYTRKRRKYSIHII